MFLRYITIFFFQNHSSPHVLNSMRCIMHPEYQTYNRAILNHYGHDSQDQNYFFLLASFKAWLHGASDIFNDTQNRPKTKQVACMKKNEMKVGELLLYHVENNSYRLDSFLDYSGILKSGSLSRKLKHKIEASYHSSKNVSCNKCTDLSFSCENSTPRNRYATNEWILDIGCSSAVSSHLTRCKSFRVKRWQVQGLIQK